MTLLSCEQTQNSSGCTWNWSVFYFRINWRLLLWSNVRNTQRKLQLLDADSAVLVKSHQLWPHPAPLEGAQQPPTRWLRRDTEAWPNDGVRHASYWSAAWKANAGSTWVTSTDLWKPVGTARQVMERVRTERPGYRTSSGSSWHFRSVPNKTPMTPIS